MRMLNETKHEKSFIHLSGYLLLMQCFTHWLYSGWKKVICSDIRHDYGHRCPYEDPSMQRFQKNLAAGKMFMKADNGKSDEIDS